MHKPFMSRPSPCIHPSNPPCHVHKPFLMTGFGGFISPVPGLLPHRIGGGCHGCASDNRQCRKNLGSSSTRTRIFFWAKTDYKYLVLVLECPQTPRGIFYRINKKNNPHTACTQQRRSAKAKTYRHELCDIHTTPVRHRCSTPQPIHRHGRRRAKKGGAGVVGPFVRDDENSPDGTTETRCLPDDKCWEEKRAASLWIALGGVIGPKTYRRRRR